MPTKEMVERRGSELGSGKVVTRASTILNSYPGLIIKSEAALPAPNVSVSYRKRPEQPGQDTCETESPEMLTQRKRSREIKRDQEIKRSRDQERDQEIKRSRDQEIKREIYGEIKRERERDYD